MSVSGVFFNAINPIARRLQWRAAARIGWMTTGAGLGFTVLLLIAGRFFPLLPSLSLLAIGLSLTVFAAVIGQLWVWLRPLSVRMVARLGDARLGLDERLTTALELLEGRLDTSAELRQAQLADALEHVRQAPVAAAFPVLERRQSARVGGVFAALIAVLALLTWLPNPQNAVLQQRHQLDETLKTEIAQIEQLQTDLSAQVDPVQAQKIEPLTDTLAELLDKLEQARADHSAGEALAALSAAKESLAQMESAQQPAAQSLQSVADALAQSDSTTAQQMAEALQNGDARQAADALSQAGQSATGTEAQSLAEALSQAAQAAAADGNSELAQNLQQAAAALQQAAADGQSSSAQQALQQAAAQLADTGAEAQTAAQAAQALANIQQAQQLLAQQTGNGGQGENQQAGTGSGQQGTGAGAAANQSGGEPGSGSGRGEPGSGNDGLYSVNGANGIIPTDNGASQNRVEDYSSVFAPAHIGGEGGEFVRPEPQNPGGGVDVGEVPGNPNRDAGSATVPYTEVYRQYSNQANAALQNDAIPLSMKDYVRQYFGALEPQ